MKITTRHARSSYGIPVILSDAGAVLDYPDGIRLALAALGWTNAQFAERCGAKARTVEGWRAGRPIDAAALNVLADALAELEKPAEKKIRRKA